MANQIGFNKAVNTLCKDFVSIEDLKNDNSSFITVYKNVGNETESKKVLAKSLTNINKTGQSYCD